MREGIDTSSNVATLRVASLVVKRFFLFLPFTKLEEEEEEEDDDDEEDDEEEEAEERVCSSVWIIHPDGGYGRGKMKREELSRMPGPDEYGKDPAARSVASNVFQTEVGYLRWTEEVHLAQIENCIVLCTASTAERRYTRPQVWSLNYTKHVARVSITNRKN
ncbi:hypothetical protein V1478_008310 [Vespula squamosa]|uniref:Uncharacterized protein n=1 Tax=Vespula squamosa TaxID=30214 RepID=A0ABD2AYF8_VESSQ